MFREGSCWPVHINSLSFIHAFIIWAAYPHEGRRSAGADPNCLHTVGVVHLELVANRSHGSLSVGNIKSLLVYKLAQECASISIKWGLYLTREYIVSQNIIAADTSPPYSLDLAPQDGLDHTAAETSVRILPEVHEDVAQKCLRLQQD